MLLDEENSALEEEFAVFGDESAKYQAIYLSDLGLISEASDTEKSIRYYKECLSRE